MVDGVFILFSALLVWLMQCGFAMLEVGCVRTRSTTLILLKNLTDGCAASVMWWLLGSRLAGYKYPEEEGLIASGEALLDGPTVFLQFT